ncbi:MAG TPA: M23 family metallopeptidase [Candidatus Sulfotelmatobacter sp.]|nr:M23 family metallopeptidase [Candidatus Sulfotelmatobacter sp.]
MEWDPDNALIRLAIAVLGIIFFTPLAHAQSTHDCGEGVKLLLSSAGGLQGGLLRLEITGVKPAAEVQAEWAGHAIPFWQDSALNNRKHALLGIDLTQPAGEFPLQVGIRLPENTESDCSAVVSVRDGHFAVEKLQVASGFVELSPEDAERAEKDGERLHAIYARATPEKLWRGKFRLPLDGAHKGSNFGKRRVLNGQPGSPHTGVDFPAPKGTPVHAAQRGRVVLADALFFPGNTVVIDHGLGIYTFYGHFDSIAVHEGDLVERGAILGRVGATGRVTGPHLHWGLIVNQSRVNPVQIVSLPLE